MLTLFRLHLQRCSAGRKRTDRSYRRCKCPIHVEGKLGEDFIRKGLKITNWQCAQQRVAEAEARGSWDPLPEEAEPEHVTISSAKERFLRDAELGRRLSEPTLRKYRLMLRQLEEFAAARGFRYLNEFDLGALRDFRDSWHVGPRTALKNLERLRAFFRFAVENGWADRNEARAVRGPARIKDTQKLPFEPEEMKWIVQACREIKLQTCSNNEFLVFVYVLRYSGLRIGDASMLTTDRFRGDDLYLYTRKGGAHVYVPLPPFVVNMLKDVKLRQGKYYFTGPESLRMETASDLWRRRLKRVFKLAKVDNGHPHRFRHTFAVELLKKGVPIEEVSILLGHSSVRITERHYAAWVQARQELLKSHVARTWEPFEVIEGGKTKAG